MSDKVVAIVQARMGSGRLPGKVLADLNGKPMIARVLERLERCSALDGIVVATTIEPKDDRLAAYCEEQGFPLFRGSENDVLDRYCEAAAAIDADIVVRITADCPFIDPVIVGKTVDAYRYHCQTYHAASTVVRRTYPRGLDTEVVGRSVLEELRASVNEAALREHVTLALYRTPERYRVYSVENDTDLSCFRWTVDEEADLRFAREIYRRLAAKENNFTIADILALLEREPALVDINKQVEQKRT